MAKHLPAFGAEAAGGSNIGDVDRFDAKHGVERCRVKRRKESKKDDRRLGAVKHYNCERHPGERRHWTKQFKHRKDILLKTLGPAKEQAKRNAYCGREEKSDSDALGTDPNVKVILLHKDREAVGWILAEPFRDDRCQAGHFCEPRELPKLNGQIPEAKEQRKTEKHQIGPRALQPEQHAMTGQGERGDVAIYLPLRLSDAVRMGQFCVAHRVAFSFD